ncbi:MAG: endolytic transglycosylase MltG [Gammaproteobacteria bacterium]|nr:endolytic transglycosylase MltG [Gammaproteobacteria bacterium]
MSTLRGSLIGIAVAMLICLGVSSFWLDRERDRAMAATLRLGSPVIYEVESGSNISRIASDLAARRVLERPAFIVWHARVSGEAAAIKAGEYRLTPGMTATDLLALLVSGRVVQRAFTVIEGWTFTELVNAVRASPVLEQTLSDATPDEIMVRLGHPDEHPEGRFLPDTYHFPKGTTDLEFLKRAYDAMTAYLATAWQGREASLPLNDAYEALILASIVEKETAVPEERRRIAGVFVARLRKGMRLQTDPTVIYGLGVAFDGNLRRRDLETDTPYNTYTRKGLPPTPIALPGAASIDAVVNPLVDGSLYFVARGDGSHHFSKTYEEHVNAVNKYQLRRRSKTGTQGG